MLRYILTLLHFIPTPALQLKDLVFLCCPTMAHNIPGELHNGEAEDACPRKP